MIARCGIATVAVDTVLGSLPAMGIIFPVFILYLFVVRMIRDWVGEIEVGRGLALFAVFYSRGRLFDYSYSSKAHHYL